MSKERIKFRLFQMPCCGQLLCWVNSRRPNYCPECGKCVSVLIMSGEHTRVEDDDAWLELSDDS